MKRDLSKGLATEYRVEEELKRRNVPFQHRIMIDYYEIDFLVGNRIIIEVDGYVHLTKATMEKDKRKESYLAEQGFIVLRITGNQVRNRGLLRDFGAKVKELYQAEMTPNTPRTSSALTQSLNQLELKKLREKLVDNNQKNKPKKGPPKKKTESSSQQGKKLSDRELFLQWIEKDIPPDKD